MGQIQTLLQGVLEARGKVLVKLNVPKDELDAVIDLLPSMKSPTVNELHGDAGYAVETVVAKATHQRPDPGAVRRRRHRHHRAADLQDRPLSGRQAWRSHGRDRCTARHDVRRGASRSTIPAGWVWWSAPAGTGSVSTAPPSPTARATIDVGAAVTFTGAPGAVGSLGGRSTCAPLQLAAAVASSGRRASPRRSFICTHTIASGSSASRSACGVLAEAVAGGVQQCRHGIDGQLRATSRSGLAAEVDGGELVESHGVVGDHLGRRGGGSSRWASAIWARPSPRPGPLLGGEVSRSMPSPPQPCGAGSSSVAGAPPRSGWAGGSRSIGTSPPGVHRLMWARFLGGLGSASDGPTTRSSLGSAGTLGAHNKGKAGLVPPPGHRPAAEPVRRVAALRVEPRRGRRRVSASPTRRPLRLRGVLVSDLPDRAKEDLRIDEE